MEGKDNLLNFYNGISRKEVDASLRMLKFCVTAIFTTSLAIMIAIVNVCMRVWDDDEQSCFSLKESFQADVTNSRIWHSRHAYDEFLVLCNKFDLDIFQTNNTHKMTSPTQMSVATKWFTNSCNILKKFCNYLAGLRKRIVILQWVVYCNKKKLCTGLYYNKLQIL